MTKRLTKSGKPHAHSVSIQRQGGYSIIAADMLKRTLLNALEMERIWGARWRHTEEAIEVREAIGNYLAMLKEQS